MNDISLSENILCHFYVRAQAYHDNHVCSMVHATGGVYGRSSVYKFICIGQHSSSEKEKSP